MVAPWLEPVNTTRVRRMSQIRSLDEESGRNSVSTLLSAGSPDGRQWKVG